TQMCSTRVATDTGDCLGCGNVLKRSVLLLSSEVASALARRLNLRFQVRLPSTANPEEVSLDRVSGLSGKQSTPITMALRNENVHEHPATDSDLVRRRSSPHARRNRRHHKK